MAIPDIDEISLIQYELPETTVYSVLINHPTAGPRLTRYYTEFEYLELLVRNNTWRKFFFSSQNYEQMLWAARNGKGARYFWQVFKDAPKLEIQPPETDI